MILMDWEEENVQEGKGYEDGRRDGEVEREEGEGRGGGQGGKGMLKINGSQKRKLLLVFARKYRVMMFITFQLENVLSSTITREKNHFEMT